MDLGLLCHLDSDSRGVRHQLALGRPPSNARDKSALSHVLAFFARVAISIADGLNSSHLEAFTKKMAVGVELWRRVEDP